MRTYFLTSEDTDFKIKGSRDPLALQKVWQDTARALIPYLSTVSNNIKNFQTIALALFCKGQYNMDGKQFNAFWLRWEQLLAYTRYDIKKEESENQSILGILKLAKLWETDLLPLSDENLLLQNQRNAGVWGQYNTPFGKMAQSKEFQGILEKKIKKIQNEKVFREIINKDYEVNKSELKVFRSLFEFEDNEKECWRDMLLADRLGNGLNEVLSKNIDIPMKFYEKMEYIKENINEKYRHIINQIIQTEKVISPILTIFHYLQTRSFWRKVDLEEDKFITKWKYKAIQEIDEDLLNSEEKKDLYKILKEEDNWQSIALIVSRDNKVAKERNGLAWIRIEEDILYVDYRKGENFDRNYDPKINNSNSYFFSSYLDIFNALK